MQLHGSWRRPCKKVIAGKAGPITAQAGPLRRNMPRKIAGAENFQKNGGPILKARPRKHLAGKLGPDIAEQKIDPYATSRSTDAGWIRQSRLAIVVQRAGAERPACTNSRTRKKHPVRLADFPPPFLDRGQADGRVHGGPPSR